MKQIRFILLFVFLSFSLFPCYSQDETSNEIDRTEKINQFHSDIQIKENGNILVTETISVYAAGETINHGIYRVLPLQSNAERGNKSTFYTILKVSKDGLKEPYHTKMDDNLTLYIGDENISLQEGNYTYKIVYEVEDQIHSYNDFDEIYWNVTGNDWDFEINNVSAKVTLPGWASVKQIHCYTGTFGSTENNCTSKVVGSSVYFDSQNLKEREGFTVAVGFPKGIVKQPFFQPHYKIEDFLSPNKVLAGLIPILICFLFYYFSWKKYGKDPTAPKDIENVDLKNLYSAPALYYIKERYAGSKALLTAIISLSIKGAIEICDNGKQSWANGFQYFLKKGTKPNTLSKEEEAVYETLFEENDTVIFDSDTYKIFRKGETAIDKSLSEQYNLKDYFRYNFKQILIGIIVVITVITGYCYISKEASLGMAITGALFLTCTISLIVGAVNSIIIRKYARLIIYIPLIPFAGVFTYGAFFAINVNKNYSVLNVLVLFLIIAGFALYLSCIYSYTKLGLETKLKTKKFEQFLLDLPVVQGYDTIRIYEEYLPYAFALEIQKKFNDKFIPVLNTLNYTSNWVKTTGGFSDFAAYGFLSFTQSCDFTDIDGSSGSSGGGSSGGGSGGGGGGGW
ncbi:putative membrane protein DUF2207 [Flavobacterium sp. 270]|uniref:DUF2207 domain-containing protein n=1 Tax=Flavobacterium sp. 270 TaxID=2512114 RepID=UPI001065799D|nr:DUF2207 domain-containing protein [Flavobacterium sp. 270]TDW50328.1 putative membrane protein DUF2207 [Flavobacterium sp. 270]